jgi:hypothetical protein
MGGFISDCGNYGVFKFGKKQWMVVYCGQQLDVFNTIPQCRKCIKEHSVNLETVTPKPKTSKTPVKIKPRSKRTK